ncbi:enoyl-CoA hydratase/isomerase family protein [Hazenella coriacea]|uniref:Ethylmalonyl-CoA decarboxylase n=1 Tax=Hazenella coriacea TaxID=1179467 RepID=A0A4R3L6F4_9BACL|nr:enoyl-CoA hydratase/isomerase family protein [Hazenella coriacea]TCS94648.1 enoyl-CoA hydratase/carnithine racemase [Hazenella coriacea]
MQTLICSKRDGIGWIRFHRPEVRNAVNQQMMTELEQILDEWSIDPEIKVLVLIGDSKAFASGGDVAELHQLKTEQEIYPVMERMGRILERFNQSEKVTIAAVEGVAVGGGCEIVTSCDFCLASPSAQFGMIQVKLAITAGWGGATRLIRKVGKSEALKMLLTGEKISAEQAKQIGLVDSLVGSDAFVDEIEQYAKKFTQAPLSVIQAYKNLTNQMDGVQLNQPLYQLEATHCSRCWESDEHHQAVESFLQRTRKKT